MQPDSSGWTVVIRGHWNRMVFSPAWVARELFRTDEVEVLVPFSLKDPVIFRKDGLSIHVGDDRVMLTVSRPVVATLAIAEDMAKTILNILRHTPVAAFGINFRFKESPPSGAILPLFRYPDEATIATSGWDIRNKEIGREVTKEGRNLNLTFGLSGETVTINANFDFPVENADAAAGKLGTLSASLHEELLSLLNSVYGLTPEATHEG
jgi:hypothetical protein